MGDYKEFIEAVYQLTKIDLNSYKERQMKRRIDALITRNQMKSYTEFVKALRTNKDLLEEFVSYLTINVSEFFRNPEQWKILEQEVIPMLIKANGNKLKIWSAACSTGEEPYSLVMMLAKYLPLDKIHIIATDIDKQILEKAQMGLYQEKYLKGLPNEYLDKYFSKVNEQTLQIAPQIKKCVEFKQHDLLKDSYHTGCDLILCRNVMIYFTEEAKTIIYQKFHQSLKTGGVLFVGSTEQMIQAGQLGFDSMRSFFYKKR